MHSKSLKQFFTFGCFSAIGWVLDFIAFSLLVRLFEFNGLAANVISSIVGVTFVWFSSLKVVFGRASKGHTRALVTYWGYQFFSILGYSQILYLLASELHDAIAPEWVQSNADVIAKLVVTPFNLATNFLFMKILTRYMRSADMAST
jgi:putative flippase GtrA